jgi:polysaccharide biosynthesis protein PelD
MSIVKKFRKMFPRKICGVRTIAIIEILIFYTLVLLYDMTYGSGDRFFSSTLHPFYFMVLLVSVQYGTIEGIAATVIGTLFLYSGQIPQQTVNESLFEYQFRLSIHPLIWFISAFILGEIRLRVETEKEEYKHEASTLKNQSDIIAKEYEVLKVTKENLEAYLVSQQQSIANTYKALRGLEILKPAQVLSNLEMVVQGALRVNKFSVYAMGDNGLEIAQSHGWEETDQFKHRILSEDPVFEKIIAERKVLCVVNENDEQVLDGEGLLAGALVDPDKDEVLGMLKIEEMNFMELNISSIEAFKGLCDLIGVAYSNAARHKELEAHSIYDTECTELMTFHFYELQREYLQKLCKQSEIDFVELVISFQERKSREVERMLTNELYSVSSNVLPPTAQTFLGDRSSGDILILLPSLNSERGSQVASDVLQEIDSNQLLSENKVNIRVNNILKQHEQRKSEDEQKLSKN